MSRAHSSTHGLRLVALFVLGAFALSMPLAARADESSGRWTGQVSLWGNYYWETSTRVEAPGASFRLSSPEGIDIHGEYLLDAITSASVAAGVSSDVRFTEIRNQGSIGFGHEFDLGGEQLRLDVSSRVSVEPDYVATGVTLSGVLSMAERCSLLGFSLGYIHDDVGSVIQGAGSALSNRGRVGQLEGVQAGISFTQILGPTSYAVLGYDLVHNYGFIQNAYRQVQVAGGLTPEHHPALRTRHSFYGRLAWIVPESDTAFHLLYRVYVDDWGIGALTPEARIYQGVGRGVYLRLRYRYYNQLHAFFAPPIAGYSLTDQFVTADQKMMAFENHLFGLHLLLPLHFLSETPLAFLEQGRFILSGDYYLQGSRFGDAVIVQAGVEVPF
ncbi:MAG: DUF3570 domain-containing protein [Sandaracinus sp.]